MPKVNGKEYAYTPKGMAAAKKARKKKSDLVERPDFGKKPWVPTY